MDEAAITAGPVMNLTKAAKEAAEFPHAMIFGCNAMKRPTFPIFRVKTIEVESNYNTTFYSQRLSYMHKARRLDA